MEGGSRFCVCWHRMSAYKGWVRMSAAQGESAYASHRSLWEPIPASTAVDGEDGIPQNVS